MKIKKNVTSTNTRITMLADTIQNARAVLSSDNKHIYLNDDETRRIILVCLLFLRTHNLTCSAEPVNLENVLVSLNIPDNNVFDFCANDKARSIRLTGVIGELSRVVQSPDGCVLIDYALESLEYDVDAYFNVKVSRGTRSSNSKKKSHGIYYTPNDVVNFIVSKCVAPVLQQVSRPSILDCSCGSGVFLLQSLQYLEAERNLEHDLDVSLDILSKCIWGIDISQSAVDCCKTVFLQYYLDKYKAAFARLGEIWDKINNSIFVGDATHLADIITVHQSLPQNFDCIVGNPPYVTEGRESNLFIPFVDNMMYYSSNLSCSALILPLSVCYSQGREFVRLRERIQDDETTWIFMNYDRSPDSLFGDQVKTRNTILFRSNLKQSAEIFTTTLQRWTSAGRDRLFSNYELCDISEISLSKCVPKISNTTEKIAYDHICSKSSNLSTLFLSNSSEYPLVINGTAYNWICAYDHVPPSIDENGVPYISSSTKIYYLPNKASRDFCVAILSNRIAYWYWAVIGDGFHFNSSFLSDFKVGKGIFTDTQYDKLCQLGNMYSEQIKRHPTVSYNAGKKIINYSQWEAAEIVRSIEKIIIDALNLTDDFSLYIAQWYSKQVNCDRDSEKR